MWKKALARGAVSYCVSTTIAVLTALVTLLNGAETVCVPTFVERMGSESAALLLQPLLIGLIGFAFGAGSVLFQIEKWSFLRQGAAHIAVTAAVWIPVELLCFSPITPPVVLSFTLSAGASYAITWSILYFVWRANVQKLNENIHLKNKEDAN